MYCCMCMLVILIFSLKVSLTDMLIDPKYIQYKIKQNARTTIIKSRI